jgi:tRNA A37 threonylcarbamoyladenosine dehydratase
MMTFSCGDLVRHDLDWATIGEQKVDAVAARLKLTNPEAEVSVRRHRLSGQEASARAESALPQVSDCDLIIDATAEPNVFNVLSSVATAANTPMV